MYLLKINIVCQFHVLCMDAQDFEAASCIRNTNVDFTIKSPKPPEGWVDGVGSVGGCHHDHMSSLFEPVHQRQELRDNAAFHLTMSLEDNNVRQ